MAGEENRIFLSDEPIESVDQDEFDHQEYVDTLVQILQNAEPAWNVGVFGKWGAGKSSIVNLLFKRLDDNPEFDDVICVEFNAWTHAEGSVRTDLLLGIDRKLGEKTDTSIDDRYGILGEDYITKKLYDVSEVEEYEDLTLREYAGQLLSGSQTVTGIVVITAAVLIVGVILNTLNLVGFFDPGGNLLTTINSILQIAILPLFLSLFVFMAKQVDDAASTLRRQYPRAEWSGAYEQLFDEILTELVRTTDYETIIISIDNLDRCESETVYDVLVSLKTFMGDDRCLYIIPCDEKALLYHINAINDAEYFGDIENDREFLRKMFQSHLRIPPFTDEAISDYVSKVNERLGNEFDEEVLSVITKIPVRNPRRIKQAINRLTTLRMLAEEMEATSRMRDGVVTNNLPFLAKISVLQEDFPDFYWSLHENYRLLDEFDDYYAGRITDSERERLKAHFELSGDGNRRKENELKQFLSSTRFITVDDPRPFIYLSDPSYLLTLEDGDRFIDDLRNRRVDKIRDELRSLFNERGEFAPYHQAIEDTLDEWSHSDAELFNIIEGVMEVFDVLDEDAQAELAEVLSRYLIAADRRHFLEEIDPHLSFPVLSKMPRNDAIDLFRMYGRLSADPEHLNENVLNAFVIHADNVPRSSRQELIRSLVQLRQNQQTDAFKTALDRISTSSESREKFVTTDLLKEVVEMIELDTDQGQIENKEYYLKFDEEASTEARSDFVSKLFEIRSSVYENEIEDQLDGREIDDSIVGDLLQIKGAVSNQTATIIFKAIKDMVDIHGYSKDRTHVCFYYYSCLPTEAKDKFVTWLERSIGNWGSDAVPDLVRFGKQYDIEIPTLVWSVQLLTASEEIDPDDGIKAIQHLSSNLTDSNVERDRRIQMISYLAHFDTYFGEASILLNQIEKLLEEHPYDRELYTNVALLLDSIEFEGNVDECRVETVRERIDSIDLAFLASIYLDHTMAYIDDDTVGDELTGLEVEPNEAFLRSIETELDISENEKDDFRREISNWVSRRAREGKPFDPIKNEKIHQALKHKWGSVNDETETSD